LAAFLVVRILFGVIVVFALNCFLCEEMNTGKPMFPGKNAKDELLRIFKALGTPTPDDYAVRIY